MKLHLCIAVLLVTILLAACQSPDPVPSDIAAEHQEAAQATQIPPAATAVPTREPSADWQIIKHLQPEDEPKFAAFLDETFGISTCGVSGLISQTVDAGHSWSQPPLGQFCPTSIEILENQSMWLCNAFGVFTSKDGGNSMGQMYSPYSGCRLLSFSDDINGWSSFEWKLASTIDGAIRWTEIETPPEVQEITALFLREPQVGYFLTADGIVYSTDNGGESWASLNLGIEDSGMGIVDMDNRPSTAIHFEDDQNGVVILNLTGDGTGVIIALHTIDGGQSWEQHQLPINPGAVYLSRDGQYLTVTEHGGAGGITILKNMKALGS